jgi:hypothetical protein
VTLLPGSAFGTLSTPICQLTRLPLSLFGHGTMSELSPLCAAKRTSLCLSNDLVGFGALPAGCGIFSKPISPPEAFRHRPRAGPTNALGATPLSVQARSLLKRLTQFNQSSNGERHGYARAYIQSIGSAPCVRHWLPVFVKTSKLPSIRPRPSCDANIDIPKRRLGSAAASLD